MIFHSNVHTHCTWCDGANTAKEMADAAVKLGFTDLGFSSHSPTPFDPTCPGVQSEEGYRAEINALKAEYAGRLNILCGMEQDYYAPVNAADYDYVIGSIHYLKDGKGGFASIDNTIGHTKALLNGRFAGNTMALLKEFYEITVKSAQEFKPTIAGHFDLIKKHNEGGVWFNEEDKAYQSLSLEALDAVLEALAGYGGLMEVNTGAISKKCRKTPYPEDFLLKRAAEKNARIIITADSHKTETLNFAFEETAARLKNCGFKSMVVLKNGVFEEAGL